MIQNIIKTVKIHVFLSLTNNYATERARVCVTFADTKEIFCEFFFWEKIIRRPPKNTMMEILGPACRKPCRTGDATEKHTGWD